MTPEERRHWQEWFDRNEQPGGAEDPAKTARLVELEELLALARLGLEMRRAQRDYFEAKKRMPHAPVGGDVWRRLRGLEERFDRAAREALNREQQALPGMGGEEGGEPP